MKFGKTYLSGHVLGRPWLYILHKESAGVVAGTMNHIGLVPWIQVKINVVGQDHRVVKRRVESRRG